MKQTLRVQLCQILTSSFQVFNGDKQGGGLTSILCTVYVDSLLGRLEQSGVCCHIGGHLVSDLAYTDDVTLIATSLPCVRRIFVKILLLTIT